MKVVITAVLSLRLKKDITEKYMINRLCSVWFRAKDISDTENRMTVAVEAGKAEWSRT